MRVPSYNDHWLATYRRFVVDLAQPTLVACIVAAARARVLIFVTLVHLDAVGRRVKLVRPAARAATLRPQRFVVGDQEVRAQLTVDIVAPFQLDPRILANRLAEAGATDVHLPFVRIVVYNFGVPIPTAVLADKVADVVDVGLVRFEVTRFLEPNGAVGLVAGVPRHVEVVDGGFVRFEVTRSLAPNGAVGVVAGVPRHVEVVGVGLVRFEGTRCLEPFGAVGVVAGVPRHVEVVDVGLVLFEFTRCLEPTGAVGLVAGVPRHVEVVDGGLVPFEGTRCLEPTGAVGLVAGVPRHVDGVDVGLVLFEGTRSLEPTGAVGLVAGVPRHVDVVDVGFVLFEVTRSLEPFGAVGLVAGVRIIRFTIDTRRSTHLFIISMLIRRTFNSYCVFYYFFIIFFARCSGRELRQVR